MKNRLLISDRSAYIFSSGYIPNYSDSHRLSHLYRTTRCQALLNLGKMPIDPAIAEAVEEERFYEVENPYLKDVEL